MSEKAWKNTLYVTQRGPNIGKELASELKNYLGNLSWARLTSICQGRCFLRLEAVSGLTDILILM